MEEIENKSPEEMGALIAKIGSAQIWAHLGKIVTDQEIDGATLLTASLEDLVELFVDKPLQAKRVYLLLHPEKNNINNNNNNDDNNNQKGEEKKVEEIIEEDKKKILCNHGNVATMVTKDGKKVMCAGKCSFTSSPDRISFADFKSGKKSEIEKLQTLFRDKIKMLRDNNQSLIDYRISQKKLIEKEKEFAINQIKNQFSAIVKRLDQAVDEEIENNDNEIETYSEKQNTFEEILASPSPHCFYQNYKSLGPDFNFENEKKEINSNFFQKQNVNGCFFSQSKQITNSNSITYTKRFYSLTDHNGKINVGDWSKSKVSIDDNQRIAPVSSSGLKSATSKYVVPKNRKTSLHFSVNHSAKCALAVIFSIQKIVTGAYNTTKYVGIMILEGGCKAVEEGLTDVDLSISDHRYRLEFNPADKKFSLRSSEGKLIFAYKITLNDDEFFYPEIKFDCSPLYFFSPAWLMSSSTCPFCPSNSVTIL